MTWCQWQWCIWCSRSRVCGERLIKFLYFCLLWVAWVECVLLVYGIEFWLVGFIGLLDVCYDVFCLLLWYFDLSFEIVCRRCLRFIDWLFVGWLVEWAWELLCFLVRVVEGCLGLCQAWFVFLKGWLVLVVAL